MNQTSHIMMLVEGTSYPVNRAFLFLSSVLIFKFGSFFFCSVLILLGIQVEVTVWAKNTLWLVTRVLVCLHIENVCSSVCPVSDTLQRLCPTKLIATCVFSFCLAHIVESASVSPLCLAHTVESATSILVILFFWCHRLSFTELSDPVEGQL